MQAPQPPSPHPSFVPVSPKSKGNKKSLASYKKTWSSFSKHSLIKMHTNPLHINRHKKQVDQAPEYSCFSIFNWFASLRIFSTPAFHSKIEKKIELVEYFQSFIPKTRNLSETKYQN